MFESIPLFFQMGSEEFTAYLSFCSYKRLDHAIDALHIEEKRYYETLSFEKRKESYLFGRLAAKRALMPILEELDPRTICIKWGVFNFPYVHSRSSLEAQVSIAHCQGMAVAVGFGKQLIIGIDLEKLGGNESFVLKEQMTEQEIKLTAKYDDAPLLLWTIKESLSKALKTGLTAPMKIYEIDSIELNEGIYSSTFINFYQYKTVSWIFKDYILSVTHPKNTRLVSTLLGYPPFQ